jgi:branched-chain amino acid transport system substrate-binding protein
MVVALMVAVVGTIVLCGCPPKPSGPTETPKMPTPAPAPKAAPTGPPIKIGAIFSVTGPGAPLGEPEKMTTEMLKDKVNGEGGVLGRPIEVIIKDSKTNPQETVIAAKSLIENDKVVAIMGTSDTPTTMAIKDLCQKAQVPLVSCAAGKPITTPVASYIFAVPQTNTLAVEKIFKALDKAGIKSVAVLSVDNAFGKDGLANIEKIAPEHQVKIVAKESFGTEDTDMTAQLTRIKGKSPAAIIMWGTNPGPAIACKNAKTLGIKVPIIQSHGVANGKFLELAGDAANGVQLPAGRLIVVDQIPATDTQKPVLDAFAQDFSAKYGKPADTFAGHACDSFNVVVNGLKAAGADDRAKLRDAIEKTQGFVGTAGVFNYSPTDHNGLTIDAFVWVTVEGGKWKLAE